MSTLDDEQIHAVTTVAWRHLCSGRAEDACVLFELLAQLMPARSELRMALAHALLACGQPAAAVAELQVLASSSDPAAHFLSGQALARLGRMAEARAAFERYRACLRAQKTSHAPP